jgi:hypothetical protein
MNKQDKRIEIINCTCGCGQTLNKFDGYYRTRKFINGHNTEQKYEDPKQYKREWNHRNRKQRYLYKIQWLHKLKIKLIIQLGGKCKHCNYQYDNTNAQVFDFHHLNPKEKDFNISYGLNKKSLEQIKKEILKTELLCSNCHRLLHSERY